MDFDIFRLASQDMIKSMSYGLQLFDLLFQHGSCNNGNRKKILQKLLDTPPCIDYTIPLTNCLGIYKQSFLREPYGDFEKSTLLFSALVAYLYKPAKDDANDGMLICKTLINASITQRVNIHLPSRSNVLLVLLDFYGNSMMTLDKTLTPTNTTRTAAAVANTLSSRIFELLTHFFETSRSALNDNDKRWYLENKNIYERNAHQLLSVLKSSRLNEACAKWYNEYTPISFPTTPNGDLFETSILRPVINQHDQFGLLMLASTSASLLPLLPTPTIIIPIKCILPIDNLVAEFISLAKIFGINSSNNVNINNSNNSNSNNGNSNNGNNGNNSNNSSKNSRRRLNTNVFSLSAFCWDANEIQNEWDKSGNLTDQEIDFRKIDFICHVMNKLIQYKQQQHDECIIAFACRRVCASESDDILNPFECVHFNHLINRMPISCKFVLPSNQQVVVPNFLPVLKYTSIMTSVPINRCSVCIKCQLNMLNVEHFMYFKSAADYMKMGIAAMHDAANYFFAHYCFEQIILISSNNNNNTNKMMMIRAHVNLVECKMRLHAIPAPDHAVYLNELKMTETLLMRAYAMENERTNLQSRLGARIKRLWERFKCFSRFFFQRFDNASQQQQQQQSQSTWYVEDPNYLMDNLDQDDYYNTDEEDDQDLLMDDYHDHLAYLQEVFWWNHAKNNVNIMICAHDKLNKLMEHHRDIKRARQTMWRRLVIFAKIYTNQNKQQQQQQQQHPLDQHAPLPPKLTEFCRKMTIDKNIIWTPYVLTKRIQTIVDILLKRAISSNADCFNEQDKITIQFVDSVCFNTNYSTRDKLLDLYKTRSTDTTLRYELFQSKRQLDKQPIFSPPNYTLHHVLVNTNRYAKFNFFFAFRNQLQREIKHWQLIQNVVAASAASPSSSSSSTVANTARHQQVLLKDFFDFYLDSSSSSNNNNDGNEFIEIMQDTLKKWFDFLSSVFKNFYM